MKPSARIDQIYEELKHQEGYRLLNPETLGLIATHMYLDEVHKEDGENEKDG